MPSWNIHTAHVERLFSAHSPSELGIADPNAFLFGNYVPDLYLGFMVPNTTFRLDYCLTHMADVNSVPIPGAERFWDQNIHRRRATSESGFSLVLGAWAHLAADRVYNLRFRAYAQERGLAVNDDLRKRKQADFDLFGRSLSIASHVSITPALLEAAHAFRPYSILADDVTRAVEVASAIVDGDDAMRGDAASYSCGYYQELSEAWLNDTFDACNAYLADWLVMWRNLERDDWRPSSSDIMGVLE